MTTFVDIPQPEQSYSLAWFEPVLPDVGQEESLAITLARIVSDHGLLGCRTIGDLENYVRHILDEAYAADVRVCDDRTDPVQWLWGRHRRLVSGLSGFDIGPSAR